MSLSMQLCVCEVLSVLVGRYFGSAEGSKFVEMASVDNVKRTWVNYGAAWEWSDPTQGQVGGGKGVWLQLKFVNASTIKMSVVLESSTCRHNGQFKKHTQPPPSLSSPSQGEEFLYHATEVKNIWLPMGEIFAN